MCGVGCGLRGLIRCRAGAEGEAVAERKHGGVGIEPVELGRFAAAGEQRGGQCGRKCDDGELMGWMA